MRSADKNPFQSTRRSLLSRLRRWDDHDSWREFFETYWRLIYDVAKNAGLNDAEAQDVVQETILSVAKQMPGFRYDSERGQFKAWLRQVTRRRIMDHLRRRYREPGGVSEGSETGPTAPLGNIESIPDPASESLDAIWDREWADHLASLALQRVKRRVRPEHFQIFELLVIQGWPVGKVAKDLDVSVPLIYVTRHRINAMLKKEVKALQASDW